MNDFPHETSFNYESCLEPEKIKRKFKEIISTAPRNSEWTAFTDLFEYGGFWYSPRFLEGTILAQEQFRARPTDIILCSAPKTGTTWLKALAFSIINRDFCLYDPKQNPLLLATPHECVPFLEADLFQRKPNRYPDLPLLATHLPYSSLPESVLSSACKLVYICRDPKDVFVSLWHFVGNVRGGGKGHLFPLEQAFDLFCRGVSLNGPYWDHVLEYWRAALRTPAKVMLLKFEDLKRDAGFYVERLGEFMGYPFSLKEKEEGVVEKIVELCSFENLSKLEVNRSGKYSVFSSVVVGNQRYFRKGEVGDWKNWLGEEMKERLDLITEQKLKGFGLTFD
ncbi:Sulfotransferase [Sarracenia purpurea var. burkii]